MRYALTCHPDTPCGAVEAIAVEAAWAAGRLALRYVVRGRMDAVRWPAAGAAARTDGLWKATCFEAFVRGSGGGYREFNLSPSGAWAAYRFDGYRAGMAPAEMAAGPGIVFRAGELSASLDLGEGPWRLGLSAVIEAADGTVSYWALAHPAGKPDFHHADCFAAELPDPEAP